MTTDGPAGVAAGDQTQAEMRLGVAIFYATFKSQARTAPDLITAKRWAVEALHKVHEQTPWTVDELMYAIAEAFAMLYKSETSGESAPAPLQPKGSLDA